MATRTAAVVETELWTDRYRPKRFVDLLGDEVRPSIHARRLEVPRRRQLEPR